MIARVMSAITKAVAHPLAVPAFISLVAVIFATAGLDTANIAISILTLALLPILQHSQSHDTLALQTKIDALIRSIAEVPNTFAGIEESTEEEIAALREEVRRE